MAIATESIRDLEHRFNVGGLVFVAQVCSPDPHSAAPVSAGAFDVQIVTCANDELSDNNNDDPEFLARRVVVACGVIDIHRHFHDIGNMKTKTALSALSALAQESRLAIFRYLVEIGRDGSPVGKIADALGLPAATLSFHLKELTHADLLVSRQDGRFIWYTANFDAMNGLIAYLTENCCAGQAGACVTTCVPKSTKSRRRIAA